MVEAAVCDHVLAGSSERPEVNGDMMMADAFPTDTCTQSQINGKDQKIEVKKLSKRKRDSMSGNGKCEETELVLSECRQELDELLEYYKEVSAFKVQVGEGVLPSINAGVGCLLEESNLPFSKLVGDVYEKLKTREGNQEITLASVRGAVLFVGQRMMYGIANEDADVLEDESESCLWCWETRDMKLLPANQRGILNVRRIARKKIAERIAALSGTLSALAMPDSHESYKSSLLKASEKLGRALNVAGIRSLVQKLEQKNASETAEKESKLKDKELMKEFERNRRNAEKERKRLDRELQKERLQSEKENKRLQDEAAKEEKRREKEEAELKKKLKKQQEETEKDQRNLEKEEAELKKQLSVQKQATIMQRFLKCTKSNNSVDNSDKLPSTKASLLVSSPDIQEVVNTTTSSMDHTLSRQDCPTAENLRQLHVAGWHKACRFGRSCRWGVRQKLKIKAVKEIKLHKLSSEVNPQIEVTTTNREFIDNKGNGTSIQSPDKLADGWEEAVPDDSLCHEPSETASSPTRAQLMIKKLLQFDKSHRPAYYGTWHKKSSVVGPRQPFKKDPDLDYDVDSDEEWEEEDPGESLSDCERDEDECLEEGNPKSDDDDESEDGFFVPDGYLSENEGAQAESPLDAVEDEAKSTPCCEPETETEESRALRRHQKYLHNLTDQALRKSQPMVILNLMHDKYELLAAADLAGTAKIEQICLKALCMQSFPGCPIIDISMNPNSPDVDQKICNSQTKTSTTPATPATAISESDMLEFVGSIRAHPQGINKVVESLQRKFPTLSKSQLRNKVREMSDFVDNRWQVKKEVLGRLGLSLSPDEGRRPRSIATFFSKRCLPPVESMNIQDSSQGVAENSN